MELTQGDFAKVRKNALYNRTVFDLMMKTDESDVILHYRKRVALRRILRHVRI